MIRIMSLKIGITRIRIQFLLYNFTSIAYHLLYWNVGYLPGRKLVRKERIKGDVRSMLMGPTQNDWAVAYLTELPDLFLQVVHFFLKR